MMGEETLNRLRKLDILYDFLIMTLGSCIAVSGYVIFVSGNHMLSSGVWGLAAVINHFVPVLSMSLLIILFNGPLLLWGWKKLSLRFAIYTLYIILLQSVLLYIFPRILPFYTNDIMLSCVFGGLLEGAGGGLIVRRNGSSGGTEIAAVILKERFDTSPAYLNLAMDAVTVLLAGLVFGIERAMYTIVEHVIFSVVFSQVLEGINRGRCLMIVTEHDRAITQRIMTELGRGVTILQGRGGWTGREKSVLYCVVTKLEMAQLKEIVRIEDPQAFICITNTHEIFGRFDSMRDLSHPGKQRRI